MQTERPQFVNKNIGRNERFMGKLKKGTLICPVCFSIFFDKQWHHILKKDLKKIDFKNKDIKFQKCLADEMIEKGLFEGELIINNLSKKYEAEILHLIASFGSKAKLRDSQDRIIKIEKQKDGSHRILTTENQLAVRIGKKIVSAHKKAKIEIHHSKEPYEVSRVVVSF